MNADSPLENDGRSIFIAMMTGISRLDPSNENSLNIAAQYLGNCIRNVKRNFYKKFPSDIFTEEHFAIVLNYAFNRELFGHPVQKQAIKFIYYLWTRNNRNQNLFAYKPDLIKDVFEYLNEIIDMDPRNDEICNPLIANLYKLLSGISFHSPDDMKFFSENIDIERARANLMPQNPHVYSLVLFQMASCESDELTDFLNDQALGIFMLPHEGSESHYSCQIRSALGVFALTIHKIVPSPFFLENLPVIMEKANQIMTQKNYFQPVLLFFEAFSSVKCKEYDEMDINLNINCLFGFFKSAAFKKSNGSIFKVISKLFEREKSRPDIIRGILENNIASQMFDQNNYFSYESKHLFARLLTYISQFETDFATLYDKDVLDFMISILINDEGDPLSMALSYFINILDSEKTSPTLKESISESLRGVIDDIECDEDEESFEKLGYLRSILGLE